jgi:hypothetical protein
MNLEKRGKRVLGIVALYTAVGSRRLTKKHHTHPPF